MVLNHENRESFSPESFRYGTGRGPTACQCVLCLYIIFIMIVINFARGDGRGHDLEEWLVEEARKFSYL